MSNAALVLAFTLAIAIGWALGRWQRKRERRRRQRYSSIPAEYYQGLNYLLNEQPDRAIDVFIRALEVNSDTVETHLNIGKLFRKRGEVDKAILVHQNLLARSNLTTLQQELVQLELARDYFAAGVFDRAERLLQDLLDRGCHCRQDCQRLLLTIFEQEKDWTNAIVVAEQLALTDRKIEKALAHYCCEVALSAMEVGEWNAARRTLKRAASYDRRCVRVSMLQGELEMDLENYREAAQHLRRVRHQDPGYLPEVLKGLQQCYEALGNPEEYKRYLQKCLAETPNASVAMALSDRLHAEARPAEAASVMAQFLKSHPNARGVNRLLDMKLSQSQGGEREDFALMQQMLRQLIEARPVYRCATCGFSGKKLHWQCPSCHAWGSVNPIQGVDGQ